MKLDRLWLHSFKNLKDFCIDFDESKLTTVLVGRNATGKSNLLEALIIIFRDLDLGAPPTIRYVLDYVCRDKVVHVDADPERAEPVRVLIDGDQISYRKFTRREEPRFLPNHVFGYYSGPSNRMEAHFGRHQEQFYRALIRGADRPLRPLFYARLVHSQFVLLAFFIEQDPTIMHFLRTHLWIESLESVLFVMKSPPWLNKKKTAKSREETRFWGAQGVVRRFLEHLYSLALAPLRHEQRVHVDLRKTANIENLYLFLPDIDALRSLLQFYPNQQEFFKALESTYISELMSEVRIRVKTRLHDGALTFRELSEGEQQLLMVLGLLRATKEKESLFLLDEPDTHLNPAWRMRYIDFLRDVVGEQDSSHIIMTTHDPLVIAGLEREQVQIMRRDVDSGRIFAELPEQAPRGMGVEAILTSELFGLRSTLDRVTLGLLDRKRHLATQAELSINEQQELDSLNSQLAELDFTNSSPDPLYLPFVRAMAKMQAQEKLLEPVLTPEQLKMQRDLAASIVADLLTSGTKNDETH